VDVKQEWRTVSAGIRHGHCPEEEDFQLYCFVFGAVAREENEESEALCAESGTTKKLQHRGEWK
jgi:hypothetical protein